MRIPDDVLPRCTVRIDVGGQPSGSGFFVGHGLIATCAHVVESPADPSSPLDAGQLRAVITRNVQLGVPDERALAVEVRGFYGEDDLAVLKLRDLVEHESVLLDGGPFLSQDDLHTFAYPGGRPDGVARTVAADGSTGDGLQGFSQGQIQPGMSGAALYNHRTGGVCGVISLTREQSIDLGGYAIPVGRLLTLDPALRKANAEATGAGMWMSALSAEQFQGFQIARALESAASTRSFTVSLGQTGRGWSVTALGAEGEELEREVDLNTVREEVARLFRDWASRGRVPESEQLRLLGGILFSAAFPNGIGTRLRALADDDGGPVVVNLRFEPGLNPRLVQLPWEHLCILEEPESERYLATDERFALTRVMPHHIRADGQELSHGFSVALVAVAEAEPRDVVDRIERLNKRHPGLDARVLRDPDPDDLFYDLDLAPPTVLHYVGLGQFNQGRDEISIGGQFGSVEMLIDALPERRPRLVILQMVGSPSNVVPADFSVFAPALIRRGVGAVLAYQYPVEPGITNRFNRELYRCLLAGQSLERAVQAARRKMMDSDRRSFVSAAVFLATPVPFPLCLPTETIEQTAGKVRPSSFAIANV